MNKRTEKYVHLLSPLKLDRDAVSVLFCALHAYGSDSADRVRIANDLELAAMILLDQIDADAKKTQVKK